MGNNIQTKKQLNLDKKLLFIRIILQVLLCLYWNLVISVTILINFTENTGFTFYISADNCSLVWFCLFLVFVIYVDLPLFCWYETNEPISRDCLCKILIVPMFSKKLLSPDTLKTTSVIIRSSFPEVFLKKRCFENMQQI